MEIKAQTVLSPLKCIDGWHKHNRRLLIEGPARSDVIFRLLLYFSQLVTEAGNYKLEVSGRWGYLIGGCFK